MCIRDSPKLWDNPKEAEAGMRERRRLEASIGAVNTISAEMQDAIEFIELGEMEDDEATIEAVSYTHLDVYKRQGK